MPIIQLSKSHHPDVLNLFGADLIHYHFLVNDLLKNNDKSDSFRIFGEYENGKLVSILLNNFENITYYSIATRDISVYQETLNRLSFKKLSGPSKRMAQCIPFVKIII